MNSLLNLGWGHTTQPRRVTINFNYMICYVAEYCVVEPTQLIECVVCTLSKCAMYHIYKLKTH